MSAGIKEINALINGEVLPLLKDQILPSLIAMENIYPMVAGFVEKQTTKTDKQNKATGNTKDWVKGARNINTLYLYVKILKMDLGFANNHVVDIPSCLAEKYNKTAESSQQLMSYTRKEMGEIITMLQDSCWKTPVGSQNLNWFNRAFYFLLFLTLFSFLFYSFTFFFFRSTEVNGLKKSSAKNCQKSSDSLIKSTQMPSP